MHAVTDTATHDLLTALFGEQEESRWQARALCAQVDPDAFFPEKGGTVREAKRVCAGCPVRAECLEWALANDEAYGVWGGLSERERRPLVRDCRISRDADDAKLAADGEKRCRGCQKIRPVGEFQRNRSMPDGLKASCKRCCAGRQRNRQPSRLECERRRLRLAA